MINIIQRYCYFISIILLSSVSLFGHVPKLATKSFCKVSKHKNPIRVLLKEFDLNQPFSLSFTSKSNFACKQPHTPLKKLEREVMLCWNKKAFHIKKQKKPFHLIQQSFSFFHFYPENGLFMYEDRLYQGFLSLMYDSKRNTALLINTLDLEDYVYAVLPSEIFQSWPHQMQKIQAIVTRTYAAHLLKQNERRSKQSLYDVKNNNHNQTYKGLHAFHHVRKAIDQTRGLILTYQQQPALTMFDACCGGTIPADMEYIHDYSKAPYLARTKRCTFCKDSKLFQWKKEIPVSLFMSSLKYKEKTLPLEKPTRIRITQHDRAGIVQTLHIKGKKNNIELKNRTLHHAVRSIFQSLTFKIKHAYDHIIAQGVGYGHQSGLCQYGARELVKRRWDTPTILNFYYPTTILTKMS